MNIDPGAAATAILTVVVAAAAWIKDRNKNAVNNARQIKNDENATEWQNSLLESNRDKDKEIVEVRQQKDDAWMLLSEARRDLSAMEFDAKLWKYKFEEESKRAQTLQAEIDRLKAKENP